MSARDLVECPECEGEGTVLDDNYEWRGVAVAKEVTCDFCEGDQMITRAQIIAHLHGN